MPQAVAIARTVPDAADVPYPGTMQVRIDATDVTRGLYRVTQTIPVATGTRRLTLLLPQWLPGNHAPRGTMAEIVDLGFRSGDRVLKWRRDPVEVFAFHVDLPEGITEVTARFIHTSPRQPSEGRITMTPDMLNLQWDKMTLYPAGHYVRQIRVRPAVRFPDGWRAFTALDGQSAPSGEVSWAPTDYETLVDSPIFAGRHAQRWDLGENVSLDAVADEPKLLALPPAGLAAYRALVTESLALFGGRHFDRYAFLLALSDQIGGIGLEHQRSSENQMERTALIDWAGMDWDRNVLPHELVHSWIGKFRRPARMWTPDYRLPMQNDLLWVYEGQTQFWGYVLAARSGVQSKDVVLGQFASIAGTLASLPGRSWRSVEDTTFDPVFGARKPKPFASLARGEDYYIEGALIWLEADQLIRRGTGGRKGLDDFARAFFGVRDGDIGQMTFEFDDVVAALNAVYPYDWAGFLDQRIREPGRPAPLAGLEQAGYRLTWREEPNAFDKGRAADARSLPLAFSLGLTLDKDGKVTASQWDSPAFKAGIVTGARITGVNGKAYTPEGLRAAITLAKGGNVPIQLLVQRGEAIAAVAVPYYGGLRYPWIERTGSGAAGLDLLLAPRAARR